MYKKLLSFAVNNIFFIFLTAIVFVLIVQNYKPGTWLSGWDTLHPEFNLKLAFRREFAGVWRQEMGLGNLMGHTDTSEFPRLTYLKFASMFLPASDLRYSYVFLSLIAGPLGVYSLLKKIGYLNGYIRNVSAFLGACYYLFNYATLQHFYVPLEMFVTLYAFLPWLFLISIEYIRQKKQKYLFLLFIISFFSAPMAWAATLFYSYFIIYLLFISVYTFLINKSKHVSFVKEASDSELISKNHLPTYSENSTHSHFKAEPAVYGHKRENINIFIKLILVIVISNSFWLIPGFYSILKQGNVVMNSKINLIFSDEAFISNRSYGNIQNFLINKNHLFSWQEYNFEKKSYQLLLDEWKSHTDNPSVNFCLYLTSLFILIGLIISIIKRIPISIAFILPLLLCTFFIINENPPFAWLYSQFRQNISIFREGLRMPFTKFSIPLILFFSYYLSYFVSYLGFIIYKFPKIRFMFSLFSLAVFFILLYPMVPAFRGYLVSPSMKVHIPDEYFQFFEYMKEKKGRIAKFPIHTRYGWTYYNWGFQGASFIQFGLENPLLDRDFDRWSAYNETFYNQLSHSLYQKDIDTVETLLEKYNITYLLIDNSIITASDGGNKLFTDETRELFRTSNKISFLIKIGFLEIYKVDIAKPEIYFQKDINEIVSDTVYSEIDPVFEKYGIYANLSNNINLFPFVNYDTRSQLIYSYNDGYLNIKHQSKKPIFINNIFTTSLLESESDIYADIFGQWSPGIYEVTIKYAEPDIEISDKVFPGRKYEVIKQLEIEDIPPSYLSIENEIFSINGPSYQYLGSAVISSKNSSQVKLYSSSSHEEDEDLLKILSEPSRLCSDPMNKTDNTFVSENNLIMNIDADSVCVGKDLFSSKDLIAKISFSVSDRINVFPEVCFSGDNYRHCLSNGLPKVFAGTLNNLRHFEYIAPLKKGYYWIDFVGQGSPYGKGVLDYIDIKLTSFETISDTILLPEDFKKTSSGYIPVNSETTFINIKYSVKPLYNENFSTGRGYPEARNCDYLKRGNVAKSSNEDSVTYTADYEASACDYLTYPGLSYSGAYFLYVSGINYEGQGLSLYFYNPSTGHTDLEERTQHGQFVNLYPILSKNISGNGYVLNLDIKSFYRTPSKNSINKIFYLPFPEKWLNQLIVNPNGDLTLNKTSIGQNVNLNKENHFRKIIDISQIDSADTVIVFNQAYADGWIAYLSKPFGKRLDHILINGWANGWVASGSENSKITLVYWPSCLQFAGFILTIGGFVTTWVYMTKRPKS